MPRVTDPPAGGNLFPGWRREMPWRLAYLGLSPDRPGLPLAHEGGTPFMARDRATFDLVTDNLAVTREAMRLYHVAETANRDAIDMDLNLLE